MFCGLLIAGAGNIKIHNVHDKSPRYLRIAPNLGGLEQPFVPSQIPQRTKIRQRERKSILVLIPHRTQVEAAEFQTHSAAIPVIRGLDRSVLEEIQLRIEPNIGRSAEALFAGVAISQQESELVKELRPENNIRVSRRAVVASTDGTLARNL